MFLCSTQISHIILGIIIYLIVAAIVGVVAESIVGWRLPFAIIGAIIAALIGVWIMTNVIIISGVGDLYIQGVITRFIKC